MNAILTRLAVAALLVTSAVSCTTAYDAYGRPVQVVDPATAAVGAAAVGAVAYGIGRNADHHHHYYGHHYGRPYYGRPHRYVRYYR